LDSGNKNSLWVKKRVLFVESTLLLKRKKEPKKFSQKNYGTQLSAGLN
jgi:hypothetical protein